MNKVSCYTKVQDSFAQIFGYVEQNDIHSPHVCSINLFSHYFHQDFEKNVPLIFHFKHSILNIMKDCCDSFSQHATKYVTLMQHQHYHMLDEVLAFFIMLFKFLNDISIILYPFFNLRDIQTSIYSFQITLCLFESRIMTL